MASEKKIGETIAGVEEELRGLKKEDKHCFGGSGQ